MSDRPRRSSSTDKKDKSLQSQQSQSTDNSPIANSSLSSLPTPSSINQLSPIAPNNNQSSSPSNAAPEDLIATLMAKIKSLEETVKKQQQQNNNNNDNINNNHSVSPLPRLEQFLSLSTGLLPSSSPTNNGVQSSTSTAIKTEPISSINPNNFTNTSNNPILINDNTGITFTDVGQKLSPQLENEIRLYPNDSEIMKAELFLDKSSHVTFIQYLYKIGMHNHYPSNETKINTLSFPVFNCDNDTIAFLKWRESIIAHAKMYECDYYITNPWSTVYNRIMNSELPSTAIKHGVIIKLMKLYKFLYSKLKLSIESERIVSTQFDNDIHLHSNNNQLFIEGNVNYLYRALDYNYERVNSNTINQLTNEFIQYRYPGELSNENTSEYFNTIETYRYKFIKFRIHKADHEFTEKVKYDIPKSLRTITWGVLHNVKNYAQIKAIIISATTEFCNSNSSASSTNHVNHQHNTQTKSNNKNKKVCIFCPHNQSPSHSTKEHYPCRRCQQQHKRGECSNQGSNQSNDEDANGVDIDASSSATLFIGHVKPLYINHNDKEIFLQHDNGDTVNLADENGTYRDARREVLGDSGCSSHLCCNEKLLVAVREISPITIRLPDGKTYMINKMGNMMLTKNFYIRHVLLLPNFQTNLLSIGRLATLGFNTVITDKGARITKVVNNEVVKVLDLPKHGNLFIVRLPKDGYDPDPHAEDDKEFDIKRFISEVNIANKKVPNKNQIVFKAAKIPKLPANKQKQKIPDSIAVKPKAKANHGGPAAAVVPTAANTNAIAAAVNSGTTTVTFSADTADTADDSSEGSSSESD
jgi:hypothetical protein